MTTFDRWEDQNAYWQIRSGHNQPEKGYEDKVLCDDVIALEHMLMGKVMRTEESPSHVSKNHMVSVMGADLGDNSENYKLICVNQSSKTTVKGSTIFQLKNENTKSLLSASFSHNFNPSNCGMGCPIMGQLEVSGVKSEAENTKWKPHFGIYYDHSGKEPDKEKWIFDESEKFPEKKVIDEDL